MKDEDILRKAIEKAKKNGYFYPYGSHAFFAEEVEDKDYFATIYDHDFAKAFWGEEECIYVKAQGVLPIPFTDATQRGAGIMIWQYHLQAMVLEKSPLKYLERFLP